MDNQVPTIIDRPQLAQNSIERAQRFVDYVNNKTDQESLNKRNCHTLVLLASGVTKVELDLVSGKVDGKSIYGAYSDLEEIYSDYFKVEKVILPSDYSKHAIELSAYDICYIRRKDYYWPDTNIMVHSLVPVFQTNMFIQRLNPGQKVDIVKLDEIRDDFRIDDSSELVFRKRK